MSLEGKIQEFNTSEEYLAYSRTPKGLNELFTELLNKSKDKAVNLKREIEGYDLVFDEKNCIWIAYKKDTIP